MKNWGSKGEMRMLLVLLGGWREATDWKRRSIQVGKAEVKPSSLFADGMLLRVETPKAPTKPLDLLRELSTVGEGVLPPRTTSEAKPKVMAQVTVPAPCAAITD